MGIRIHYIPPAAGTAREAALRGSPGRDFSGVTYIAPTDSLLYAGKLLFKSIGGECYRPPRLQKLSGLCRGLHKTYGSSRIVPPTLIPLMLGSLTGSGMGLSRITAGFINELKRHFPGRTPGEVRAILSEAMTGLNVPEEVSKRAFLAMDGWDAYKEALERAGAIDDDDLYAASAEMIREHIRIETLVIDGYYEMNNAELEVVSTLIEAAAETLIFIPVSDPGGDLSHCFSQSLRERYELDESWATPPPPRPAFEYHAARSMEEEVEQIAREIKQGYLSGTNRRLDETVVGFPDIEPYRAIVERVFHKYGVPYRISRQRRAVQLRPFQDLLALLEAVAGGYPRVEFCRALASPYFTAMPPKLHAAAPTLSLRAELGSGAETWLAALTPMDAAEDGRWLMRILRKLDNSDNTSSYSSFIEALNDILSDLGFKPFDGLEEFEAALTLLASLDEIMGTGTDLKGFIDAFRVALDRPLKDSADQQGVYVAELRDIRGLEPWSLYLAGLRDDAIPAKPELDLLMPESIKHHLGLVDMKRHLRLQEMVFTRLAASARALRLSYPSMEGDKFFIPSLFLSGATEVQRTVAGIYSEEELQVASARPGAAFKVQEIGAAAKHGLDRPIRVTDIDAYRRCPRRFYIERILDLEPLRVLEYEIEPETIGIAAHRIMERLGPQYSADPAEYATRAQRIVEAELKKTTVLDAFFRRLLKESFMAAIPDIHKFETSLRSEGYFFGSAESKIEGEIEGVSLVGKADRVDSKTGGALVIDFKTGGASISQKGILERGESLQLPLYAAMLRLTGVPVDRICMYSLKDMKATFIPGRRKPIVPLDEFIDAATAYLVETASAMRSGAYPASPIEEGICRTCHEAPYCPFIQGTA